MGDNTKFGEALARAVQFNYGKCIRSLVKAGADPNLYQNEVTPLIRASCSGDAETVAVLIKEGADINAVNAKYPFGQPWDFNEGYIETDEHNDGIDDDDDDDAIYPNQKEWEVKETDQHNDGTDDDNDDNDDDDGAMYLNQKEWEVKDKDGYNDCGDDDEDNNVNDVIKEKLLYCKYYDDHNEDEDEDLHRAHGYHTRAKAIFHAAANGHHECLDLLLKAGADANDRKPRDGNTPLIRTSSCAGDECE